MDSRGVWTDVRLRAAWAGQDWGAVLREYRRAAKISQRDLERLIGIPQPHISAIERGRRRVTAAALIARIAEGLEVPPEMTGIHEHSSPEDQWGPPQELRERIAHGHTTGRTDTRTADWIAQVLAHHRRAEDEVGGRTLWPVVMSQMDAVTRLIPGSSGQVADKLILLAAEHAHWLSWVSHTEGKRGAALSWIDLAHGWAVDGGHADMASWACRIRSYYSLMHGDPVRALRTAESGQTLARGVSAAAESVAAQQAAMAAAALGERERARRLADRALGLALQVPDEADRPGWLYWLTPVRAELEVANAASACHQWADAAARFRAAIPDLEGYPRDRAYYQERLEYAERRI